MQSVFLCSRRICLGTYHRGKSKRQSLGGKMMHHAGVVIA
jgi:hypothetical protein